MTKQEFECELEKIDYTGEYINDYDYAEVEYIYTWYPGISEVNGKAQIAMLYKIGGMPLMHDMLPRTNLYKEECEEVARLQALHTEACERRDKAAREKITLN